MAKISLSTTTADVYIKRAKNNIVGVIFRSKKAIRVAKENNVRNHYEGEANFRLDINQNLAGQITNWANKLDLTVDSELKK